MGEDIELRVAKAMPEDSEKGIIRLDSRATKKLGVAVGDIVEVEGKKLTAGIVQRAYPSDVGLNVIRMDGLIRKNADTSIGEMVKIRAVEPKEAKKITLAPAQKGIQIQIVGAGIEKALMRRPFVKGDIISPMQSRGRDPLGDMLSNMMGSSGFGTPFVGGFGDIKFVVTNTNPKGVVFVTERTEIEVSQTAQEVTEERIPDVTYEDIGGLKEEISKVREMIELPLKHPEIFERLGVEPPKGVLLYGPPGTGKTLLAKAVANETNATFTVINGPEVMSKWYGESEKKLREIFEQAQQNAPSIIFIDELDAIAPKREEVHGEVERRVVAQLLSLMDGLAARGQVVVIGATNRQDALDPALRRPGRFDREIMIGVPNRDGRKEVLQIHTRRMPLEKDVNLDFLADVTYGYVGADLAALVKEAAMATIRRLLLEIGTIEEQGIPKELLEKLIVTKGDFEEARRVVEPSAMREVLVQIPNVKWDDIGGLDGAKEELIEAVEWPLSRPDSFKKMGIRPPKGVLLFGPPGTGKTLLAKAVANESNANFISVKGPELISKWVGESEKAVRKIFKRARQVAPAVVFFDELDSVAPRRGSEFGAKVGERVVDQLLTEMDGLEELTGVVVIGATNRPDIIDPGLLRPGRFDRHILTGVPDREGRLKIFGIHTKNVPLAKDVKIEKLADLTDGFVGADIEALTREAAMRAMRRDENAKEVTMADFEKALEGISPTMSDELKKDYEGILKEFKQRSTKKMEKDVTRYLG